VQRIRRRSFLAFEQAAIDAYVRELAAHLLGFAQESAAALSPEERMSGVRHGVARAAAHGFDQRGTVRFYVETMMLLGSDFDTDPQVPWAGQILADPAYRTPMDRAESLHRRLLGHLAQVDGEQGDRARVALAGLATWLVGGSHPSTTHFEDDVMHALARVHPAKLAACGETSIRRLVAGCAASARGDEPHSALARIALMFAFGHRFDTDPWLVWMRRDPGSLIGREQAAGWIEQSLAWNVARASREAGK
jgi:hypothetical protein